MPITAAVMVPHPPIILPEIGRGEEKKIQATIDAYNTAADLICARDPETIVISSPHSIMYRDYFHISPGTHASGSFARFGAGQVKISADYDTALVEAVCRLADEAHFPAGTMGEKDRSLDHGTMIPLYFIRNAYERANRDMHFQVVRIGLSGLPLTDHYRLGMMIRKAADDLGRSVCYVASGDLSHKLLSSGPYGFAPEGPVYDERIMDVMGRAQFDELLDFDEDFCDKAAECGHRSFVMMAGALDRTGVAAKRLSHEGTFGIGYGVCTYETAGIDESRDFLDQWEKRQREKLSLRRAAEDPYVQLARLALETYVRTGRRIHIDKNRRPAGAADAGDRLLEAMSIQTDGLPQEMLERSAGVFVSIHKEGRLRGCIGTISAVQENIADEIIHNAISAGTRDPRFDEIQPEELKKLDYSVDVLGPTERISSPKELDVKRYGVIVTKGNRRGLLLPNLDGVDTIEDQIAIARQKAAIGKDERGVTLERFEVVRHY